MHREHDRFEDWCVFEVERAIDEYVAIELWSELCHCYFFDVTLSTACSILFLPSLLGSVGKSTTRPVLESTVRRVFESRVTSLPVARTGVPPLDTDVLRGDVIFQLPGGNRNMGGLAVFYPRPSDFCP